MSFMAIQRIAKQGITRPFGDHRTVKQAFPAAIESKESDPFLMCDYFGMEESQGEVPHEDEFPVDWHPHRGFDIASYLKSGTGRHGDSLGNRETYETPGMQWMSVGSGVEHAEGGGNPKGQFVQGFQVWINVPGIHKMDDPRYGTVPTKDMPLVVSDDGDENMLLGCNSQARILAGKALGLTGPFETVQDVQMIDFELQENAKIQFNAKPGLDTAILYVYEGSLSSLNNNEEQINAGSVVLLDANSDDARGLELTTSKDNKASVLLFAGKKIKEPIAWHGPIVMNTQEQVRATLQELRTGRFPPKRVDWDYKRLASKPPATTVTTQQS